jgi:NAD(P)-dependent dehydrogenase (short-subunit alcohol dehydrogenase family)
VVRNGIPHYKQGQIGNLSYKQQELFMGKLTGKTAIITGATSGIGKATALLFAEEGADLVITGRRAGLGTRVEAEARARGVRCVFVEADHARAEDCQNVVDVALRESTEESVWDETLALNVTAVWRMSKLVLPVMKKQGRGVIVNNGSDWSVVAGRDAFPYVVSKGAVGLMTKAMALDFARDGIRVNAVCPGDTFVDRWLEKGYFEYSDPVTLEEAKRESSAYIPMGRFGQPDEIAHAVLFLASEDSSFVTGHLLLVDGGNTAQ